MNNFIFGVLIGFLTFNEEGKKLSQKAYEVGIKYGKDVIKQMNKLKGDNQCTNITNTGKQ